MKYTTIIQKNMVILFQSAFDSESDEDALKVHTNNIDICERDIAADWDTAHLIVTDEYGNILRFVV